MTNPDPVGDVILDDVILAYLDQVEGTGPGPDLTHLDPADRRRAEELLDGLVTARGLDPYATRPSLEALLADTPLAGLLPELAAPAGVADLPAVRRALAAVDPRARVELATGPPAPTVVYSYLDLRARFVLVDSAEPELDAAVRSRVDAIFAGDPDTSRVGVVAAGHPDLVTRVLAAEDVGPTITTPRGDPHLAWGPALPLPLAARRMLEQSAPEWPAFDLDGALSEPLDVASVAAGVAGRIIAREAGRAYRGEKRRAYRALVGREAGFAELVALVAAQGAGADLEAATHRLVAA
jgi:hypothetical protein